MTSLSLIPVSLKSVHSEEAQDVEALLVTTHCVGAAAIGTLPVWVSTKPSAWPGQGLRAPCEGMN